MAVNVQGKRSSQRIRLMKHELVFIERITPAEFERQKEGFSKDQVARLLNSKEYKRMKREKGSAKENWNWQTYEAKHGAESDISSEYDIISNYNQSSSDENNSQEEFRTSLRSTHQRSSSFRGAYNSEAEI